MLTSLRSHRRASTAEVALWLRSHVACVFKPCQNENLEMRDELENGKSKSMIVSSRKELAKRLRRILKVNDLHLSVVDAARDLGIDTAGGGRRRRNACNQTGFALQDAREKGKSVGTEQPQKQSSSTPQAFSLPSPTEWRMMTCRPQI